MDGITLTPLKKINNPKGDILHALKKSDLGYNGFGEAYFSIVKNGCIKGWKKHTEMILNLIVIEGEIKFVVFDDIKNEFFSIKLSQNNYKRITINSGLWLAFQGLAETNMLLNIGNVEHDPHETIRVDLEEFKYEW